MVRKCPLCGAPAVEVMRCPDCGAVIDPEHAPRDPLGAASLATGVAQLGCCAVYFHPEHVLARMPLAYWVGLLPLAAVILGGAALAQARGRRCPMAMAGLLLGGLGLATITWGVIVGWIG